MVRLVDYEARRKAVLRETINTYIKEATPVSSEEIARDFDLSSATIRNIFAELEENGYLTHPYTSGGRIPTPSGYRYYVDCLMLQTELLEEEKEDIIREYRQREESRSLEDILIKTSEVISHITRYAGIASSLEWQDRFFYKGISLILSQPEFRDFERVRLLIKMLEERQYLLNIINRNFANKVKVYIGEELHCPGIESCALVVSSYAVKDKPLGRLAVLGPMRMEYRHIIPVLEYISDTLTELLSNI